MRSCLAFVLLCACGPRAQPPTYTPLGESHVQSAKLSESVPPDANEFSSAPLTPITVSRAPTPQAAAPATPAPTAAAPAPAAPAQPAPAPAPAAPAPAPQQTADAQPGVASPPPPPD
jgi:hypothetical protein